MEKRFLDRGIVSPSLDDRSSKLVGVCVEITEHASLTRLLRELGAAGMAVIPPAGDVTESDILHALHNLLTVIIWNLERSVWRMTDDGTPWAVWMALHAALTTAIAPQRPPHPPDTRSATPGEPKAITVLLVEDDGDVRDATAARLADMGHHVLTTDSAEAALDLLAGEAAVDLVLSDVNLPQGMSGIDLARRAAKLRPRIKFVFVSGNKLSRETERELCGEVLLKPYRREDLAGAMTRALGEARHSSTSDGCRI